MRTAWLLNEFLQQTDRTVPLRVGNTISAEILRSAGPEKEATNYLRWRTYLLGERGRTRKQIVPALRTILPVKAQDPVAESVPRELLQKDIEELPRAKLD